MLICAMPQCPLFAHCGTHCSDRRTGVELHSILSRPSGKLCVKSKHTVCGSFRAWRRVGKFAACLSLVLAMCRCFHRRRSGQWFKDRGMPANRPINAPTRQPKSKPNLAMPTNQPIMATNPHAIVTSACQETTAGPLLRAGSTWA